MLRIIITIICICLAPNLCNSQENSKSIDRTSQPEIDVIVIDPGFGGNESGPVGCNANAIAKNINLQISKRVSERIKKELGYKVILTREIDGDMTLEERTAIANTNNADLFISIHLNASENPLASGIETFYLNLSSDNEAIKIAAQENASSPKNVANLQSILSDLMQNTKLQGLKLLAENIQENLYMQTTLEYPAVKTRGIKQAPLYVLLTSQMPAVVIYPGFITNTDECRLLVSETYQEKISIGIVAGIRDYLNESRTQPVNVADPKSRSAN